jgi:RCC1 and BTB domain-containing protein
MWFDIHPILSELKPEFVTTIKYLYVHGHLGELAIIVTNNDKVFTLKKNYTMESMPFASMIKRIENIFGVNEPMILIELCDQKIIDIASGDNHFLALTKSGKCFSWGSNSCGKLGFHVDDEDFPGYYKPKIINAPIYEKVVQISCGSDHSLLLTKSGDLYGFGRNKYGQIGCGNNINQWEPIKINRFTEKKIISIACGGQHSLALTDTGKVYSWGFNKTGQLGIDNTVNTIENTPVKINLSEDLIIKSISCGFAHSLLLTTDGDIYAFGCNKFCQLGKETEFFQSNPIKINGFQKFKEIACHNMKNISVAKSIYDYCYVWGECEKKSFSTPNRTEIKSIHEVFTKYAKGKVTYKPMKLFSTQTHNIYKHKPLLKKMLKIFDNKEYSDLTIKVENKPIYVHKIMLKTNSSYFESKFTRNERAMKEATESIIIANEIEIKEYSYDVYYAFLKYIYTDCVELTPEKAIDLLVLANDYKEEELKLKCVEIIENNITIENVCFLYSASIKCNLSDFENLCFNFGVNRMNEISKTEGFSSMDGYSMKKFMRKVGEKDLFKS